MVIIWLNTTYSWKHRQTQLEEIVLLPLSNNPFSELNNDNDDNENIEVGSSDGYLTPTESNKIVIIKTNHITV